ncbi:PQ-loop repeat family protein / transmembrane family protein isoform X2 [Tasmannia lanceolata]|uniref:PQ-loop repeat family protein / transmembrane family protein isoform X2 n=1 Tax=Tasmannia lanceolata TaxID=3420 RepID=UPI004062800C
MRDRCGVGVHQLVIHGARKIPRREREREREESPNVIIRTRPLAREPIKLYTITTIVLVLQTVYYDYICRWCKIRAIDAKPLVEENTKFLKPKPHNANMLTRASPVKVSNSSNKYYTSARSLASSATPPFGSYLGMPKSGPSAFTLQQDSSSEDESFSTYTKPSSQPIRIPRQVGYGTFVVSSVNLPFRTKALMEGYIGLSGRRLLQDYGTQSNVYGLCLGWLMAAIYMGGRIPQICLNIKRGSVEGLNPLMFIFALIANATYVGSILVRSTEWGRIKDNMPWLLDAVVCVALDLFIIIQFIYYTFLQRSKSSHGEDCGDYVEAKRSLKHSVIENLND